MNQLTTVRQFLTFNSAFSALNGFILLFGAGLVASTVFNQPAHWAPIGLRSLGLALLVFAAVLLVLSKKRHLSKIIVNEIVLLDALWVLGSAAVLVFLGHLFTPLGTGVVVIVAVAVAVFAVGQHVGARQISDPMSFAQVRFEKNRLVATVRRKVNASASRVWTVMNDHPAYADVASNIAKVEILSGDGLGMKRRCADTKGNHWEETCTHYEEGKAFGFHVHTEATDYPYPLSALSGKWSVEAMDEGSEFSIEIVATPKGNIVTRFLFLSMAKIQFKSVLLDLADAWAIRMEKDS